MSSNDLISLANEVANQKENIRQAIVTAGVECPEETPLADYAGKISQIQNRVSEVGTKVFYAGDDSSLTQESTTYTVPTTYAAIAPNGLSGYTNLQSVTMQNVTSVMDSAFAGNKNLTTINAPLCKYYGASALKDTGLEGAYSNNVADSFGVGCFSKNTTITSFDLANARFIGSSCFEGCNKVESISIPNVERIGSRAFVNFGNNRYDSSSVLQKFDFSAPKVKTIGMDAFTGNLALQSVDAPRLKEIGRSAFYGCNNLTSVNIPEVEQIGAYTFWVSSSNSKVSEFYLPQCEYLGEYALYFRSFRKLTIKDGCYIGDYAGRYNSLLTEVVGKPSYIGNYTFDNCTSLTTIDLSQVTLIDSNAFTGSSKLSVIDLSSCTTIGKYVFSSSMSASSKMWLPSTCTSVNSPQYGSDIRIFTDVADASSRPANWSQLGSTWYYGKTYEDFLAA